MKKVIRFIKSLCFAEWSCILFLAWILFVVLVSFSQVVVIDKDVMVSQLIGTGKDGYRQFFIREKVYTITIYNGKRYAVSEKDFMRINPGDKIPVYLLRSEVDDE